MRVRGTAALEAIGAAHGLREYRRWQSGRETLEIVLIDDWASGFLRGFTPLPEDRTRLLLHITAAPQTASSPAPTILAYPLGSGETVPLPGAGDSDPLKARLHFGIRPHGDAAPGAFYADPARPDDNRRGADADDVRVYLESLWLYLSLALQLAADPAARTDSYALAAASAPGPEKQSAGSSEQKFERLLVTPGGSAPAETRDQFLLWYDSGSRLIRFVEFTYRDVFSFYQGALVYPADANSGSFPAGLPARVSVTDGVEESEAVHTLILESARLIRTTSGR